MAEGSDTKRQLSRVALQRKALPVPAREAEVEDRPTRPSPLEQDLRLLLMTMREGDDVRHIDLRHVIIPLSVLAYVPRELAREKQVLPLVSDQERLLVAVADATERLPLDQLALATGRRVLACVPLDGSLRDVIEAAYAAASAGATSYRGPMVSPALDESPLELVEESLLPPAFERPSGLLSGAFDGTPLAPSRAVSERDRPTAPAPSPSTVGRKVLVVDDSDDIRRLLVRALREREYEVFESARGNDALEKVREHEPDILLLDAMLPEIHGFDLCRRIKSSRRYGHIPVVMLSAVYRGWRFAEDLRRSYGVDEFLEKPFRIGEVVAAVERALLGTSQSHTEPTEEKEVGPGALHLEQGLEAYARGDTLGAIERLKGGLELDPLAFRLHYHLGLLYGKQGNVFEAIQALESAVDLKPRDFSTLKNLAVLYQRAGFRLKAAEMWERALGYAPDEETRTSIRNHLVSLL
jgi:DNA-binding response OmpR family regulator